jgi:hypothetical protein
MTAEHEAITGFCELGGRGHDLCAKGWCACACHPRKGDTRSWWLRLLYRVRGA